MGAEELVNGAGWISDDSSFYGDDDEQERLLSQCNSVNVKALLASRHKDLNTILAKHRAMPLPDLHNVYEGRFDSWQMHETVDEFLERLPPQQTTVGICPWIWAANPYPNGRDMTGRAQNQAFLVSRGRELLMQARQERDDIQTENARSPKGTVTRLLNQHSEQLKQRIANLAEETNILSGKWMLFPGPNNLARVWRQIVEGTINDRLGSAAKVATDDGEDGGRLICVYTKDFRDTNDVLRVLKELSAMGLVKPDNGNFYKSDAYTYLDIYGNNAASYGLKASMYSSKSMLSSATRPPS